MIVIDNPAYLGGKNKLLLLGDRVAKRRDLSDRHYLENERTVQLALAELGRKHPLVRVPQSYSVEDITIRGAQYIAHIMEFLPYPTIDSLWPQQPQRYHDMRYLQNKALDIARQAGFRPLDETAENALVSGSDDVYLIDFEYWRMPR